ncbi:uncharacterized protein HaLaN_11523 [Haematococcus lacustris]|uniref:Uncharacterized protein n=1 Tax=Haematococcus lacustris TaxID=44745 RepID=A0A699Z7W8_HAELA|nr:uncharacterized protein HaLaN_11523 [Haematococcus lacustris]
MVELKASSMDVRLQANSNIWYQAYFVKQSANEVKMRFPGANGRRSSEIMEWMKKGSSRIWRGSLKSSHWRHLGKGAWEPKLPAKK